ncbi:hypothetical protein [Bifidobacterium pullorum]|uniref:hypothetical protein n=1 Tax=Bifidobacterium pullorum TaxID=78448 RepID=UPI003207FCBA
MMDVAPDALRADIQRFYGLDLDELGHSVRPRRMADLAANLPTNATIWGRIDPKAQWDVATQLLADIADNTAFNAWTKTKAAQQGARWRGAIPRPGSQPDTDVQTLEPDDMLRILSMPRT